MHIFSQRKFSLNNPHSVCCRSSRLCYDGRATNASNLRPNSSRSHYPSAAHALMRQRHSLSSSISVTAPTILARPKVKFGEAADQDSQELFGVICQFIHDFKRALAETEQLHREATC